MSDTPEISLDPSRTALVLIEYQNEFTSEGGKLHDAVKDVMASTNMLENSKVLLEKARAAGCLVVHCPIEFDKVRISYSKVLITTNTGKGFVYSLTK